MTGVKHVTQCYGTGNRTRSQPAGSASCAEVLVLSSSPVFGWSGSSVKRSALEPVSLSSILAAASTARQGLRPEIDTLCASASVLVHAHAGELALSTAVCSRASLQEGPPTMASAAFLISLLSFSGRLVSTAWHAQVRPGRRLSLSLVHRSTAMQQHSRDCAC